MDDPDPLARLAEARPQWSIQFFAGHYRGRRRETAGLVYLKARTTAVLTEAIAEFEDVFAKTSGDWERALAAAERVTNGNQGEL